MRGACAAVHYVSRVDKDSAQDQPAMTDCSSHAPCSFGVTLNTFLSACFSEYFSVCSMCVVIKFYSRFGLWNNYCSVCLHVFVTVICVCMYVCVTGPVADVVQT